MGTYYLVIGIVALIAVAFGWILGSKSATQDKVKVDEELEFLEETNNLITTEDINLINAENNLNLLLDIEFGKLNSAKELLIENLCQYYKTTSESISDCLATPEEVNFIEKLENLAKADRNLQKVIR